MERLEKLVNILKETKHLQPELVKEAAHRILARNISSEPTIVQFLKPIIEILIKYCDNDDSAQRSLFNDYLNCVILTFQRQHYQVIFQVLLDEVVNNGTARAVTAALYRIPHLINNVKPLELGCEPQALLKALIEVARRADDESVLKALDSTLQHVMPYMDYHILKNKEMHVPAKSLIEVLFTNLQNDSSQTKRLAASSIAIICFNSNQLSQYTLTKLKNQLDQLSNLDDASTTTALFVGFCLCVKEISQLSEQYQTLIIEILLGHIQKHSTDITLMTSALETVRELTKQPIEHKIIDRMADLIAGTFLISSVANKDGSTREVPKEDTKIILQSNALACIAQLVKQRPIILDRLETIFWFRNHSDIAISNQVIHIIGNYIEASWRFPLCIEQSVNCEKIRKLWVELRSTLNDENAHPDTLKSCVMAMRTCINTLLESDHCLHIIEHHDFDLLVQLYLNSNFKPFKIEVLALFGNLNYRTIFYLERCHWSKMKAQTASSYVDCLQDRIVNKVIIASLISEHERVRQAATTALVNIVPCLYLTNGNNGQKSFFNRSSDPIVSLSNDLANEHLVVLKQADEHINHFDDEPVMSSQLHERLSIRNDHRFLSSSIIQSYDNPYNEQIQTQIDRAKSQHRVNITINLMYVVSLLKSSTEDSLDKGKTAISSIVKALYDLSLAYPIYQYSSAWDCRPSEYCDCFTLLNFLLTYLENLTEPDIVVEDLEAYKNFLCLCNQLLYALCHESVLSDYEHQKMKSFHKRQTEFREGYWSELTIKHPCISDILDIFFTHLVKLLWLCSYIVEERSNPFSMTAKQSPMKQQQLAAPETIIAHGTLTSNRLLFGRVHKKLESSYKSSKKNPSQQDEKFFQVLETCLESMSSLLEFIGMNKTIETVKDILGYLRVTSQCCDISSLVCSRQLLKSLFGINILALYQLDPNDWFEEESWPSTPTNLMSKFDKPSSALQGVYHHLIANPYRIFSSYYSHNCSQITPTSDRALSILNFESRRALKVRRRIEERVKSLFEFNPLQLIPPKVRQTSEILKSTISEFTPVVTECMTQFNRIGFHRYQSETLHFMSYLILLRINYRKLSLAENLINSIHRLLDNCGEKVFAYREAGIETLLRNSFTFLTLLTYERGPSKPMFQVATVIQKLDDIRAKLSIDAMCEKDESTYVAPLLRCLVEDLFIYRTKHFQEIVKHRSDLTNETNNSNLNSDNLPPLTFEMTEQSKKDIYESLEAERETVARKLLDAIDNPRVYDLISILILESRRNPSEIKYKKLSQHLLSLIPTMLSRRNVNLMDYRCVELTRRIIENISPEVFHPVNFIFETLLEAPKLKSGTNFESKQEFQRYMSLVLIAIHILITQVKEEVFLSRLRKTMSDEVFVDFLLHIAQLCISEINIHLMSHTSSLEDTDAMFLSQQLASYILYLTHMFQSGLFFQLSRSAVDLLRREVQENDQRNTISSYKELCLWARNQAGSFSLSACERMFFHTRLVYPDLSILWCNVMMLLNNVDCNRNFWRNLLVYECHHCSKDLLQGIESISIGSSFDDTVIDSSLQPIKSGGDDTRFKRSTHINRPSSLNLSDISFSDQLRRSFIKKIADAESKEKTFNRNIIETSDEDGQLMEREVTIGNTEQCLAPNMELTRRGALCLVLDFVTISMNDVEHITWLIIHYINDIIRWSYELPITEFINAVHGNSASSGIFIQAINSGCNNLSSISFVTRLLWSLEQVHYTQYGSLIVLLVEKLLCSNELLPYKSLTRNIEEFACATAMKLLNETNKSLVTTNDEVLNQLAAEDLDRIYSMLDEDQYPNLTKLLVELRESTSVHHETPTIAMHISDQDDSDDDSQKDEVEVFESNVNQVFWLAEKNHTAHVSTLIPALNLIKDFLANRKIVEKINSDESLVCFLISAVYSLALNHLESIPPPKRLVRPTFWEKQTEVQKLPLNFTMSFPERKPPNLDNLPITKKPLNKPTISLDSSRFITTKPTESDQKTLLTKNKTERTLEEMVEAMRVACLKSLFLLENIEYLQITQFEYLVELIIRIGRLPLVNSFLITPPTLWRHNIWPIKFEEGDIYKTKFQMVTHDILFKDLSSIENFCDRLLKLGWISRVQFEEAWMTLLGVLSTSFSQIDDHGEDQQAGYGSHDSNRKTNLLISCKVVSTITKLLTLTRKTVMGDPLSENLDPVQNFDDRVIELSRSIGSNISSLKKKTQSIFEQMEIERKSCETSNKSQITSNAFSRKMSITRGIHDIGYSDFLRIPAQKLRMNAILNVTLDLDMQEIIVIEGDTSVTSKSDDVDVESCIRLLLSIYKQKFKNPHEDLGIRNESDHQRTPQHQADGNKNKPNQLAPPLATAICQSILTLSDMFTDYEQFDWLFETFVDMFKVAERNDDELLMQYLILGLSKSASVCCYEIPNELSTAITVNHRDIMFEKCRQSIEKCLKTDFGPLKLNALFSIYYMLEDSINIVASGAWELDHFKQLRQSRLNWILRLMPIILDKNDFKLLSKRIQIQKLLEILCEAVTESELKNMTA